MLPHIYIILIWGTLGVLLLSLVWCGVCELCRNRRVSEAALRREEEYTVDYVRQRLSEGADAQELLFQAVVRQADEAVLFLLQSGVSADATGYAAALGRICSVLEYAVVSGNVFISLLLLRAGGGAGEMGPQWPPLHLAAMAGRSTEVERLLADGAEVDARDALGCTPLMLAAFADAGEVVRLLLAAGADAEAHCPVIGWWYEQWTPMLLAASQGSDAALCALLEHGAQVDGRGGYEQTPLMLACMYEQAETARLLLEAGADPNARDNQDNVTLTPLLHACGNEEIEAMLLRFGAREMA